MTKFKTKSETTIEVCNDGAYVVVELEETIDDSDEFKEFVIPYGLYQLTPTEARLLAAHLVEQAAECTLPIPSNWDDPEVN